MTTPQSIATIARKTDATRAAARQPKSPVAAKPLPAPTKSASMIKLLGRPKGATVGEIVLATNWQPHSVRAFLSGLRKTGRTLVRDARKDGQHSYRLADNAVSVPPSACVGTTTAAVA